MNRFFSEDNLLFRTLGTIADLVILNLLYILCCLPIITIGASTSALYYSTLKIVKNEESQSWRMFFQSLKQNLKQGFILTMLFILLIAVLAYDFYFIKLLEGVIQILFMLIIAGVSIVCLMTISYTFPLLAQFDNTITLTLKNAFFLSIYYLPYTLIIILLNIIPILLFVLFTEIFYLLSPFWLFIGFSCIAWINSIFFKRTFQKFIDSQN